MTYEVDYKPQVGDKVRIGDKGSRVWVVREVGEYKIRLSTPHGDGQRRAVSVPRHQSYRLIKIGVVRS